MVITGSLWLRILHSLACGGRGLLQARRLLQHLLPTHHAATVLRLLRGLFQRRSLRLERLWLRGLRERIVGRPVVTQLQIGDVIAGGLRVGIGCD